MRNTLLASLLASAFLSFNAAASDLVQIYKDALQNDAQFASARSAYTAGQERVVQGRAGLLPGVALKGTDTRTDTSVDFNNGKSASGVSSTNSWTLALSQPLFNWGNWQQYEQSKLSLLITDAQFAQAKQDLLVRVAQAYFDVLAAQDTLTTLQAQKTAIAEQLASAKRNFEVGTSTITDTHEAQARYDLVTAQEFAGQSDLEVKRSALRLIIGRDAGDLASLRAGVKLSAPQTGLNDWVNSAEKQNYGVVASQIAVEVAKREIERSKAGHYPTVDLVASTGRTSSTGVGLTNPSVTKPTTIGIQWNVPIFSGFAVDSKVKENIALEEKARNDLEANRRNAAQGARQAFVGVSSGLAQVKALEAAEISSQSALDSNKLGYQVGVRINIDVLNAQQQLYTTRQNLAKARYDTILNGLRLKNAAGNLKEDDLSEVNALLQN